VLGGLQSGSSLIVSHDSHLVLFGGEDTKGSATDICLSLLVDKADMKWSKVETTGAIPSPRLGHSAVYHKNQMWVFGGENGRSVLGDFFVLDLGTDSTVVWCFPL